MTYRPRRFGERWSEGAPGYILDVLDSRKGAERYTVLFTKGFCFHLGPDGHIRSGSDIRSNTFVQYLGMGDTPNHPQGVSLWGEMSASDAAAYRYRSSHDRIRWLDLPEHIRNHVINRATKD